MIEGQPRKLKPEIYEFINKVTRTLGELNANPPKTVYKSGWMSAELPKDHREILFEKARNIIRHRS